MRLKISLRVTIALFLAASLPLAWLGNYRRMLVREHEQAAVLESYGDQVTWGPSTGILGWCQADRVVKVVCAELRGLDEDSWRALESFAELEHLDLSYTQVTDSDMARVARCRNLSACRLGGTRVTDKGHAHLERLPKLARLDLKYVTLGDDTLAWLGRSQVAELSLWGCSFTWQGLHELAKSRALVELDLCCTTANDLGDDWGQHELRQFLIEATSLRRVWLLKVRVWDADDDCRPCLDVEDERILITLPGPLPRIVFPGRDPTPAKTRPDASGSLLSSPRKVRR